MFQNIEVDGTFDISEMLCMTETLSKSLLVLQA